MQPRRPDSSEADRWIGVGRSAHADPVRAGELAAREAARGPDPVLAIVFASDEYQLADLLGAISGVLGDTPLVGCSTAGEIATDGPGDAGVVVFCLGGSGYAAATAAAGDARSDMRAAGEAAATCMTRLERREHRVLLLLTDGLAGDQREVVRGAHAVAGSGVPLVGGCAGDGLKMRATFQMHGGEVMENAVVAAAIGSDAPLGIGVRHGWRPVGEPMLVSASEGNAVLELDDRPALDVYLERLRAPPVAAQDAAEFTNFAQTHPLGLSARDSEPHVRFVGEADFARRSLGCIAAVPQGSLVWLMKGDSGSVLAATDAACRDALRPLGAGPPRGALAFDCIGRRGVLGEEGVKGEVARVSEQTGGAPVAGFYTYGEIARTQGTSGFHNQTLVVLAFG